MKYDNKKSKNAKSKQAPKAFEGKKKPNTNVSEVKTESKEFSSEKSTLPYKTGSKKESTKARAGKKTLRSTLIALLITAFSIGILVFVVYHLFNYIAAKPEFSFISNGSVEHTIGATALVVRNEITIDSTATGDLVTKATEGSRVSTGQNIALIVPDNMAGVVDDLRNTQSQISAVQQELIASGSASGAEQIYRDYDENIGPIIDMMRADVMNGNLNDLSSYKSSLSVLMDQRENELTTIDFDDARLTILRSDEASYENQLSNASSIIKAPSPGIVSFKLDGLEDELSFDLLLNSTPETVSEYISTAESSITSDMYIDADEKVARISSNEEQYLAVVLSGNGYNAGEFEVGTLHDINVSSEGIYISKCEVVRSTVCDDGLLVVFSTTRYVESLIDLRTVNIEIVISSTSGLKVPVTCLVSPDYDRGIATIYINENGFAKEVNVLIEDNDREFAIIAPFEDSAQPNTRTVIITNPGTIKPGEKVDK